MQELIEILEELHPEIDFAVCDDLVDGKILDSFDIVTLVAEINDHFDVAIPVGELIPENFNSVDALWALIQRLDEE